LCRLLGCPKAAVSQTAKDSESKPASCSSKRSTKTKNVKSSTSGGEDPGSKPLEGSRASLKRVTRHNGGVDDTKLAEKAVVASKKGTAAVLTGVKRAASTDARLEPPKMPVQSTRRATSEKPTGTSNPMQRKLSKTKRISEETAADSKTEGGSTKRQRVEDSVAAAPSEDGDDVRHSVVEEEVVETSEVDICEDDATTPLDDEKKKQIEETQQLKLISVDSCVVPVASHSGQSTLRQKRPLSQQGDVHNESGDTVMQTKGEETAQSAGLDVEVSKNTRAGKGNVEKDRKNGTDRHGTEKKDSDLTATLSAKSDEYIPSLDAGSDVFSDGDDIENLLRIEQRCASVQSWVARHSHEEIELEPNVEQMEVEEEVTVEGAGVLLVEEDYSVPNCDEIGGKTSSENSSVCATLEGTVTKSPAEVAAADLCAVDKEETVIDVLNNGGRNIVDLSPSRVVRSSIVAETNQPENIENSDSHCHQQTETLVEEVSCDELKTDLSFVQDTSTSDDLSNKDSQAAFVENAGGIVPVVSKTERASTAIEIGDDGGVEKNSSKNMNLSDAPVCDVEEQNDAVSAGIAPCAEAGVTEVENSKTDSTVLTAVTQEDDRLQPTSAEGALCTQGDAAATEVPQPSATVTGDKDDSCLSAGETALKSLESPAETTMSTDKEVHRSRQVTENSSSHEVCCNTEDGAPSLEAQPAADASIDEVLETESALSEESSEKVVVSGSAVSPRSGPVPVVTISTTFSAPAVSVVVARTLTSTVAGSGGPAATSVVAAGAVPGFVGMPPVAIRAALPGSAVGSVFVHVADPRHFAMHIQQQQQQQQQGQVQGQTQTPVFHIPALSPQQGGGPPQLVMSPLSPQQVALLSSSMPATSQPPHQLVAGIPPRHVTLVTSGPRPQLLQQCLLTSSGPQPVALLSAAQPASTSNSTSGSSTTSAQPSVPVQHLAILSHALQGAAVTTATSTTAPSSVHQQPVALIATAGPNQTPVMRMAPAAVIPRHPMSASSAMQHLTSAVQQTISLQQLQLSFAAAAAAAQQQQQLASSAVRSPIPIQRLPVLGAAVPTAVTTAVSLSTSAALTVVSVATAPVVSMPMSPMVSVAASALTAFLKKENVASQLLSTPATTIAKLSPHDVALKGSQYCCLRQSSSSSSSLQRSNFMLSPFPNFARFR